MIEIAKEGRFLKYVDVYFTDTSDYCVKHKCDICNYQNIYNLHDENNIHSTGYTLISDLSSSEDDLWSHIHKTTRYEIRRAERYELKYVVYDSEAILNGKEFSFESFSKMYEKMFVEKGLPRSLDKSEFYNIVKCGSGMITAVSHESVPLVYHFYIYDRDHTKLTISCSKLWSSESSLDKNMIGYANKWLHWKDFLFFKNAGVQSYDWGGVTWNEDDPGKLEGINKFKASFGGAPVSYFCETVIITKKAKFFKWLSKIKAQVKTIGRK